MKLNKIIFKESIFLNNNEKKKYKSFSKKFDEIFSNFKSDIQNLKKTEYILNDNFKFNFNIKDLKKFKKFRTIALVGMGGSILGAEAIYNFFQKKIKKKIYFFNNLDENKLIEFKKKENTSKVLFILISKSGNTVETLTNIFGLNIIKNKSKNIIVISEKKNNTLYLMSKNLGLFYIEHKNFIGGRYSVLSEVGIVPAYFMGINIIKLRSKILDCLKNENRIFLKNSTLKIATLIKSKKFNNLIFLNYFPELEKFLFWCQQLVAESLGKKNTGFLPVISNVPKDHHSLLQLYLDGPKDKIFNIFSFEKKTKNKIYFNKNIGINSFLNNKKICEIKNAQKKALILSFKKKNIPFREFKINIISEESLGKLFSYFIIETIILGRLLNVDPFNQPAVEQVKIYTKKFLT